LFVDEVALLKNLKHVNVLAFKGIVSNPPSFSLLTGELDIFIRENQKNVELYYKSFRPLHAHVLIIFLHNIKI
jgi:hypothetical protein